MKMGLASGFSRLALAAAPSGKHAGRRPPFRLARVPSFALSLTYSKTGSR
jgi:hypothetical protein